MVVQQLPDEPHDDPEGPVLVVHLQAELLPDHRRGYRLELQHELEAEPAGPRAPFPRKARKASA